MQEKGKFNPSAVWLFGPGLGRHLWRWGRIT